MCVNSLYLNKIIDIPMKEIKKVLMKNTGTHSKNQI